MCYKEAWTSCLVMVILTTASATELIHFMPLGECKCSKTHYDTVFIIIQHDIFPLACHTKTLAHFQVNISSYLELR